MIKFIQKQGLIDNKNIAWVDIVFVDAYGNEYPLTIRKQHKSQLNTYLRIHGFKIGALADGEIVEDKVMI